MDCQCEICKSNKNFNMPDTIIKEAKKGNLVLFCGAGISTESRLVLPYTFYEQIQSLLNIDEKLDFPQLMEELCKIPDGRKELISQFKDRLKYINSFPELERMATRFHNELYPLYFIKTIVTTNWDEYFEKYCDSTPIVYSEDMRWWNTNDRNVLKIHGSISSLNSIIATSNDYQKCLDELKHNLLGSELKSILTKNTVVFIGFSFGDFDLNTIIDYVQNELGDFKPHLFFVTLDDSLKDRLGYENATSIITDGTYFLHELKNIMKKEHYIENLSAIENVPYVLNLINDIHYETGKINISENPLNVFCLTYQDGIIHALERFNARKNDGSYFQPNYVKSVICSYELKISDYVKNKQYIEASYFEGYKCGLELIDTFDYLDIDEILDAFPVFQLPELKEQIKTIDEYIELLNSKRDSQDKYSKIAREICESFDDEIVIHHKPLG